MTPEQLDEMAARIAVTIAPALVTAVDTDDAREVRRLLARLSRQELLALVVVLANDLAEDDAPEDLAGPADQKRCRRCDQVKPASEFYRDIRNRDGLKSYCKTCDLQIVHESKQRKACA